MKKYNFYLEILWDFIPQLKLFYFNKVHLLHFVNTSITNNI